MTQHHPASIPAAPGYFALMKTPGGETERRRIVAWSWDGSYGWPIIEAPAMRDDAPSIIHALELVNEHGWQYVGAVRVPPIQAVLKNKDPWSVRYDGRDAHDELRLDVLAWVFRDGIPSALVMDPGAADGEYEQALIEADDLAVALDWRVLGVTPDWS